MFGRGFFGREGGGWGEGGVLLDFDGICEDELITISVYFISPDHWLKQKLN